MGSEIQEPRVQNAAGALATQFEAKPIWHGRSEGKPVGGGRRSEGHGAARPRRPTEKTQDFKIQETREEADGIFGGSELGAGCSKDGLGQDVPAT
jgi:hypothetical protein